MAPEITLLAALAIGAGSLFAAWRQGAFPDGTPNWVIRVQLALVIGCLAAFIAVLGSYFGLARLSVLLPYLWYAVIAAFVLAFTLGIYANRARIRRTLVRHLTKEPAASGRISFLRFKVIAEKEHGWDFGPHSDQLLAFANGVRQGALDKAFVVEGRPNCSQMPEHMKLNYPLEPINDLNDWWINSLPEDNWSVETYRFDDPNYQRRNHRDIHINNEAAARRWLAHHGNMFKTLQPTTTAEKALIHIAHHSAVGDRVRAKMEFERAARHGILNVWGCRVITHFGRNDVAGQQAINSTYWEEAELDLTTFILYEKPRAFSEEYNHTNKTTQATRRKDDSTRGVELEVNLRVNAEQVLSIWPKTRKGSPLESVPDTLVKV